MSLESGNSSSANSAKRVCGHLGQSTCPEPIEVDLIVDFGNSRTICLLLEKLPSSNAVEENPLIRMVKPLKLWRGTG